MSIRIREKLLLLFLLLQHLCEAQDKTWIELGRIDSLLQIQQVEGADSILRMLETLNPKDANLQLRLTYLRGYYLNNKDSLIAAATVLLELPGNALRQKQFSLAAETYILLGLVYEKTKNFKACWKNMQKGLQLIQEYHLDSLYGWYYVRTSSFYRAQGKMDSSIYYAKKAIPQAQKFQQLRVLADGYTLLGLAYHRSQPMMSLENYQLALKSFLQQKNDLAAAAMYGNISSIYSKNRDFKRALAYNDSSIARSVHAGKPHIYNWRDRSEIFRATNLPDSALYYYKLFSEGMFSDYEKNEGIEIRKVEEKYEVARKENIIQEQKNRLRLIIAFSLLLIIACILIYVQKTKISRKNKHIKAQVLELNKLVQQKQILLSELQHRVKNNLQQVLSLMDIQKESLNHNNIQEVIRENQHRVYSMALLHSKLSLSGEADVVNFEQYLKEMTSLIQAAYEDPQKKISMEIVCIEKELNIDIAIQHANL